ncbi:hypothetical protein NCCP2222_02300 [Sporosarcina sp. NCCP-2222]|uniref:hypothetical protein n=1 Tax=Sporosarcina sp. NCCP-2222 TaxID=2935073 RepID=UPI0020872D46|nr:hypothetical protein [Sporosarcina sp. NCCP-2222]GKV54283.1 hypothetical protein NCCP2222_02300 [Sporosarcina sp. NCCP-2222]
MTTKQFRKKPIVVSAYRTDEIAFIETLEGTMKAEVGDWIVTGIKGEQYPVKPEIFLATYEAID